MGIRQDPGSEAEWEWKNGRYQPTALGERRKEERAAEAAVRRAEYAARAPERAKEQRERERRWAAEEKAEQARVKAERTRREAESREYWHQRGHVTRLWERDRFWVLLAVLLLVAVGVWSWLNGFPEGCPPDFGNRFANGC